MTTTQYVGSVEQQYGNRWIVIQYSASISTCLEKNYGADADGRRGVDTIFLDGIEIDHNSIQIEYTYETGRDHSSTKKFNFGKIRPQHQLSILRRLEKDAKNAISL